MDARRIVGGVVLVLLPFAAAPRQAAAQESASSEMAAALARRLEPGDRITVTSVDGDKVKGRFVDVGAGAIRMRRDGLDHQVEFGRIQKVQRTRIGVILGTAIGLGIGIGLGLAAASYAENESASGVAAFLWIAGLSTAAGVGVDAAVNLPRTVYQRDRRVAVTPVVTPRARARGVRVTF